MVLSLATLGAAVGGVEKGLREGSQNIENAKLRKVMDDAAKAGAEAYKGYASTLPANTQVSGGLSAQTPAPSLNQPVAMAAPDGAQGGLSLSQAAPGLGAPAALGAAPAQQNPLTLNSPASGAWDLRESAPKFDEREAILAGMKARRAHLMGAGMGPKVWGEDWVKEASLRSQMRAEKADQGIAAFQATGDPSAFFKTVYPLVDDGYTFQGAQRTKTPDGKDAWVISGQDGSTGKAITSPPMTQEQLSQMMLMAKDPKAGMQYEAKRLTTRLKAIADAEAERDGRLTNEQKHNQRLAQIAAQKAAAIAAARERGSQARQTEASKPLKLGLGDAAFMRGSDGKLNMAAKGGERAPESKSFSPNGVRYRESADGSLTELPLPKRGNAAQPAAPAQPQKVTSKAAYDALPAGTRFVAPDGTIREKK